MKDWSPLWQYRVYPPTILLIFRKRNAQYREAHSKASALKERDVLFSSKSCLNSGSAPKLTSLKVEVRTSEVQKVNVFRNFYGKLALLCAVGNYCHCCVTKHFKDSGLKWELILFFYGCVGCLGSSELFSHEHSHIFVVRRQLKVD